MSRDIRRVGVVGGGRMGAGIAEVRARAGLDTVVCEVDAVAARAARDRVAASLDRAVERGKLTRAAARDALDRTVFSGSLEDLADRQLVVEAVVENAEAKTEIFTALDKIVEAPDAVLASNTSSLPVMRLGRATHRADRVLGLHFFNPVPVLPLVEVVTSLHTAPKRSAPSRTSPPGPWARPSSAPRTAPASSSTPCSSPTCCRPSA